MPKAKKADAYSRRKDRAADRERAESRKGREAGPLRPVRNWPRRKRGKASLLAFLGEYFPDTFPLEWSDDHRAAVAEVERIVRDGGQLALAMPRGSGKSSIALRAALWAIVYGLRRFVVLVAAEQGLADDLIAVLRDELQFNDALAEDWPEVCYPIRRLENITKRAQGQTLNDRPTRITLATSEIVLPTVAKAKASGGIVRAVGLTGSLRGQIATADGETVRPDLVLVDDPQTRASANSPTQTAYRLALLNADVLGLAGPGRAVACTALVTVVYANDLSDRLLDREANPAWQGRRYPLLKAPPDDAALWDEYAERRNRSLREHGDNRLGNQFYEQNRERLDAGAVAAWPARFNPDEISAVQSAMNIKIDRPEAYASEYQNRPLAEVLTAGVKELDPRAVAGRVSGAERYAVPPGCSRLTAFIDVGGDLLWYAVCAWNEQFGGTVIDYGSWPRQGRSVFAAADARPGMKDLFPDHSDGQRVYAALAVLVPEIVGRVHPSAVAGQAGGFRVERLLIDAGWEPDAIYQYVAACPFGGLVLPSKGLARTATMTGVGSWRPRPGERAGHHWRLTLNTGGGRGRQVQFDADAWKSFIHAALTTPPGGPTGLSLFGRAGADGRPAVSHELLGEHCAAEYGMPVTLRGETFAKWVARPHRADNHLFDAITGAAVAASVVGVVHRAGGTATPPPPKKPGRKLSDIQREKMAARGGGSAY